jgi:protein-disulfide isomerase
VLDQVFAEYPGTVRLIFKDFPLPGHARARPAHQAARCAGSQGKYWQYHDRLFGAQPAFSREDLLRYAAEVGLPVEPFARCLDGGRFRVEVETDVAEGRRLGVATTPTFFINGVRLEGAAPYEAFKRVIDTLLPGGSR